MRSRVYSRQTTLTAAGEADLAYSKKSMWYCPGHLENPNRPAPIPQLFYLNDDCISRNRRRIIQRKNNTYVRRLKTQSMQIIIMEKIGLQFVRTSSVPDVGGKLVLRKVALLLLLVHFRFACNEASCYFQLPCCRHF